MKVKITESQHDLLSKLRANQNIKEQEFLAQQTRVNMGEVRNIGDNWYTTEITILSKVDPAAVSDDELNNLDDNSYFNILQDDIEQKIIKTFKTREYFIRTISTKARGSRTPH